MYRTSFPAAPQGAWRRSSGFSVRLWAAWTLYRAGWRLSRAAHQMLAPLRRPDPVAPAWTQLEFHAEAGAPEGALYVNGEYVGQVGVSRL